MPQSGVGSMQGSTEDRLPMKEPTRGEDAPTVLPIGRTHRGGGRTHNVTQFFLDTHTNKRNGQRHILRQHPA